MKYGTVKSSNVGVLTGKKITIEKNYGLISTTERLLVYNNSKSTIRK